MSDPVSRLRSLALEYGYDLTKKKRRAGRSRKWTNERLCDLWIKIEVERWARRMKARPAIKAVIAERKSWPAIEIWRSLGTEDYVELCITAKRDSGASGIVNTVRRQYNEAVSLLKQDAQLRQRCLNDLEIAKRWYHVKLRLVRRIKPV